jgi:hypothetical protein
LKPSFSLSELCLAYLGKDVGALLLSVPSFDTMMGPIKKPEKVRKQAVRRGPKEKVSNIKTTPIKAVNVYNPR